MIETLKVVFVQECLAKSEFDLRVGRHSQQAGRGRSGRGRSGVPARVRREPPVVQPGRLIAVATAVCAGVWMFGFLVPWPRDAEGDPPHGVMLLVVLITFIYLFVLAMTLWVGGAALVESWLKRRSARPTAGRVP